MHLSEVLLITFIAALITDLATGLGAVPFYFVRHVSDRVSAALTGAAAGMMTVASIIQLGGEAIALAPGVDLWQPALGFLAGIAFFIVTSNWIKNDDELDVGGLRKQGGASALLIVLAMTMHSLPEGVAIGVAYGSAAETGTLAFGTTIALMLAIHNVPEGVAIAAALRGQGVSTTRCVGWAVFSSIPQPLAAVPAAWMVWLFEPLLPAGLAFAAGAMMYLVITELIPDVLERAGMVILLTSFTIGGGAMIGMMQILNTMNGGG